VGQPGGFRERGGPRKGPLSISIGKARNIEKKNQLYREKEGNKGNCQNSGTAGPLREL